MSLIKKLILSQEINIFFSTLIFCIKYLIIGLFKFDNFEKVLFVIKFKFFFTWKHN